MAEDLTVDDKQRFVLEMQQQFKQACASSGTTETMSLEQALTHPEVMEWLSKGIRTRAQIQETWDSIVPNESQEMDLEVSFNQPPHPPTTLTRSTSISRPHCPPPAHIFRSTTHLTLHSQNFLRFLDAIEHAIESSEQSLTLPVRPHFACSKNGTQTDLSVNDLLASVMTTDPARK